MSIKTVRVLLGLLVAGILVLVGCDTAGPDAGPIAVVGDEITGGWVVTFVDSNGQGLFAERDSEFDGAEETQVLVQGTFTEDITFTADKAWYLAGSVFIGNNAQNPDEASGNTLTIEPGTTVRGDTSSANPGVLIITRGSKINADGTAANPITFTSANEPGDRQAGDWGGLIINGYARVQGGYAEGEGGTGEYGGGEEPIDDDDSGTIRYVRVQFGGKLFTPDNELNGIVFQAVGSGTTAEYFQVHRNADDGIEFFGGSVGVRYYVATGIQDDSLDGDDGWNGSAQFVILQSYSDDAGSIVEADGDATDVFPPSNAILANITAIAGSAASAGFDFKSDANYDVYNSVLDMQEANSQAPYADKGGATIDYFGTLIVGGDNTVTDDDGNKISDNLDLETPTSGNELRPSGSGIEGAVATLSGGVWSADFDVEPTAGTFAAETLPATDPAGNALVATDYIGAYDGTTDWWSAWIETPAN